MKYTNANNLPEGIYNAIANDTYSKGDAEYSATEIIQPPQLNRLRKLHWHELEIDIADEIWKLFGSAVHYILEKGSEQKITLNDEWTEEEKRKIVEQVDGAITYNYDDKIEDPNGVFVKMLKAFNKDKRVPSANPFIEREKRLYGSIAGIKISGKPDWYNTQTKIVDDYKVTQVYKVTKGDLSDWEKQGNIYAWLFKENGEEVKGFRIVSILKDWKPSELKQDKTDTYPKTQVKVVDIPLWDNLKRTRFVLDRIEKHESIKHLTNPKEISEASPCTPEERWHKPDSWAVKKIGGKRATSGGVFTEKQHAVDFINEKIESGAYEIEHRIGADVRCDEYCPVAKFCYQYKQNLELRFGKGKVEIPIEKEAVELKLDIKAVPKEEVEVIKPSEDVKKPASKIALLSQIMANAEAKKKKLQEEVKETIAKPSTTEELVNKYDELAKKARAEVEEKNSTETLDTDIDDILAGL